MNLTAFAKEPGGEMMRYSCFDVASHAEAIAMVKQQLPTARVLIDVSEPPPVRIALVKTA